METDEYTHPGLRMYRDSDGFHLLLPVKSEKYRRLLHLVWLLAGLAFEGLIVAALLGWQPALVPFPPRPLLAVMFVAVTIGWLFIVYRWLWYAVGRERFIVSRDMVRVRREILGIGFFHRFDRETIRDIRAGQFDYRVIYPSWGRMFIGHGEGEILIETLREVHPYGRGLEVEEARKLASLLRQEAHVRTADRRPTELRASS